jgi:predicted dienelactone hydrolase
VAERDRGVGIRHETFVDQSRSIKASSGFAGAAMRRLDVVTWYPADGNATAKPAEKAPLAANGPWPLVIYSHGTWGYAENASFICEDLARHGYIVAAPNFPLTSQTSFTKVLGPDISDVRNQVKDVSFVIDRLLGDSALGTAIDKRKIATMGHSLGAVTSYFATFGVQTRDPRVTATVLTGAADPVQAALSTEMGLAGTWHAAVPVPVLFLSAEKDLFARMMGRPHAAYSRLEKPKYEVMIKKGVHVWFHDGDEQPADGKNPDCLFFEQQEPKIVVPGSEERGPLIGTAKQREITLAATHDFFAAYLKNDSGAKVRPRGLDKRFKDIALICEE